MTRTEIIATLAAIEHRLASRVDVWCAVIDAAGNIVERIYRGALVDAPGGLRAAPPNENYKGELT